MTYSSAHRKLRSLRGAASAHRCVECGSPASQWAYDGMDPNEKRGFDGPAILRGAKNPMPYSDSPQFYAPMCRSCHKIKDLRSLNRPIQQNPRKRSSGPTPRTAAEWDRWERNRVLSDA